MPLFRSFLRFFAAFTVLFGASSLHAQTTQRVLFLGNSYTAANNLPQLFASVAASAGDAAVVDARNLPVCHQCQQLAQGGASRMSD